MEYFISVKFRVAIALKYSKGRKPRFAVGDLEILGLVVALLIFGKLSVCL